MIFHTGIIYIKKTVINQMLPWLFYKLSVDLLYIYGTSDFYSYLGRKLAINPFKYIVGWLVFLFFSRLIEEIPLERIQFMVKCIYLLNGVSNISIFGLRNYETEYFLIVLLFWIILILLCYLLPKVKFKTASANIEKGFTINFSYKDDILLLIGIVITIYEVSKYGLNVSSFIDIYSARSDFRSQSIPTIDSYLLSWNGTVILPWCFLISFKKRRYIKSVIPLALAFVMFLINGLKTWLLMYLIVVAFSILLRKKEDYTFSFKAILYGLGSAICVSVLAFIKTGNYVLAGLLDRAIILPGEINYYYIDFFSEHELLYLRESIFKAFAESPYTPRSSVQIADIYMTEAGYHNATNGLIGDYFANFGIIGILIYPFLIVFALSILNYLLKGFDKVISSVVMFILMWLLVNTSFFTWIMTGGFFIYLIILFFYKKFRISAKQI